MKTKITLGKSVNKLVWGSFCVPIIMESSVRGSVESSVRGSVYRSVYRSVNSSVIRSLSDSIINRL